MAKRSNSNGVTRFTLVGGVVTWNSTRQTIITRFAFEAELCINVMWTKADWLHGLMLGKPVVSRPLPAIPVHCDSLTTIDMIRRSKYNAKTKRHIEVRIKSIKGLVSEG